MITLQTRRQKEVKEVSKTEPGRQETGRIMMNLNSVGNVYLSLNRLLSTLLVESASHRVNICTPPKVLPARPQVFTKWLKCDLFCVQAL